MTLALIDVLVFGAQIDVSTPTSYLPLIVSASFFQISNQLVGAQVHATAYATKYLFQPSPFASIERK